MNNEIIVFDDNLLLRNGEVPQYTELGYDPSLDIARKKLSNAYFRNSKIEKELANVASEIEHLKETGMYPKEMLPEMPPSAITMLDEIDLHGYGRIIFVEPRTSLCVVTPEGLLESTKYDGKRVVTMGVVTGQAAIDINDMNDPPFVIENAGAKILCNYGNYRIDRRTKKVWHTVTGNKITRYNNRQVEKTAGTNAELYALINTAKTKGDPIVVSGLFAAGRLVADLFRFDENHAFAFITDFE
ncbi:MAG: hypothetical protein NT120_00725 [Candidatus Aenigmarchaeota archaeon]|nr:hypothetical protein [Candidatus Aenigmarchaeota archaeon]